MRSFTTILLVESPPVAAAWAAGEVILAATPASEATARALRPGAPVVVEPDAAAALGAAIASARHDHVLIVGAHEEPDATLLAAIEAWRAANGSPAYDVSRIVRYLGRSIACRDWQERGPVRFFDRRAPGWRIRATDGAILWPGSRGHLAGTLHVHAPVTLAALVATIELVTGATMQDHEGTLAGIVGRPPAALARGLAAGFGSGRAGFHFAVLDGLYALVREVRAWEVRRRDST